MTYWEYKASLDKYDTYTRGQVMDAYEAAEYAAIDEVLEIIDKQDAYFKGDENGDVWINKRDLVEVVEALRGEQDEQE